ncbi:MAG TPA: hypothetical protein ACQGQH_08385 [Xylella sp.]
MSIKTLKNNHRSHLKCKSQHDRDIASGQQNKPCTLKINAKMQYRATTTLDNQEKQLIEGAPQHLSNNHPSKSRKKGYSIA